MKRTKSTVKQLQAECKERKIGFMTSWTKMALIKRLEDEDKREASLDELKKEVEKKDKELKALDPKAVEKKVIAVNRNRLARAEKRWESLTQEQDMHYSEVERIGDIKKALRDEMNNIEILLKSLE
jgi:parvulin-like peptidyl-prolyl isomerase